MVGEPPCYFHCLPQYQCLIPWSHGPTHQVTISTLLPQLFGLAQRGAHGIVRGQILALNWKLRDDQKNVNDMCKEPENCSNIWEFKGTKCKKTWENQQNCGFKGCNKQVEVETLVIQGKLSDEEKNLPPNVVGWQFWSNGDSTGNFGI